MASHTRDGQLALTLQEGSVGRDELLRLTNTIPISKYSVFRSLATPSRLLLKNTKRKMFPIGCVIEFVLLRLSRWCCNSRSKTWGMDKEIGEHGVSNNGKRAELRENWASQISRSERMHQCALQYRRPNSPFISVSDPPHRRKPIVARSVASHDFIPNWSSFSLVPSN